MKKQEIKSIIDGISDVISLSALAKAYFGKDKSWLYHKLNEDIVNHVSYNFTDEELQKLIGALTDISKRINSTCKTLKQIKQERERKKGRYLTKANPFNHILFRKWLSLIPSTTAIIEPFAGSCNIPMLIKTLNAGNYSWTCYDIEPLANDSFKIIKRDTLMRFPTGFKVCITNPPFLAKNSATRRGLEYPATKYDDVYKFALDVMLKNCDYVAAILPESFINADLFHDRLLGVVSITTPTMFADTDCPVCLAMFVPQTTFNFQMYVGNEYIGSYNDLVKYCLSVYDTEPIKWKFNVPDGEIGVICCDGYFKDCMFVDGKEIPNQNIKHSSRAMTRINGLPAHISLSEFIIQCNQILAEYRHNTHDVFLTSFKGLRKDGKYRRRIDFKTIRLIMNKALQEF